MLRMREIAEEELAGAQAAHQAALEEASAAMEASMEVAREEIANKLQAGYDTALLTEREEQTNKLGAIDVEVGALAGSSSRIRDTRRSLTRRISSRHVYSPHGPSRHRSPSLHRHWPSVSRMSSSWRPCRPSQTREPQIDMRRRRPSWS